MRKNLYFTQAPKTIDLNGAVTAIISGVLKLLKGKTIGAGFTCFICALFGALGMFLTMSILVAPAQAQEPDLADLTLEPEMIRLQDYIYPGNIGAYRAVVKNIGTKRVEETKVVMRFNFEDVCTHTVSLDPGESKNIWCGYGASLIGDMHAEVIADTGLSVKEIDEDNNEIYYRFQISPPQNRTDIVVSQSIKTQVDELHTGDDIDFTVVLTNSVNAPTGRFASSWYVNDEKEPICSVGVAMQPNERLTISCVAVDLPYEDSLTVRYVADEHNYVVELNEDNNEVIREYEVLPRREVPVEFAAEPEVVEEPEEEGEVLGVFDDPVIIDTTPSTFENLALKLINGISVVRDENLENTLRERYLENLLDRMPAIAEAAQASIMDFIVYGIDANSMKLGAGERAAVMFSYKQAYSKLPTTEAELADVVRIANGRWPVELNLAAQDESHKIFYDIYGHVADMSNPHENAAITIMTYGLKQRAENRNLESEKVGIRSFKYIFGHTPQSTQEWNTMQAITYSGASR